MPAVDKFYKHFTDLNSQVFERAFTVTPHDTNELAFVTRALYIGVAGDISAVLADSAAVAAVGRFTTDGTNFSGGETVTIDGKVYTFQPILTNVDGNVAIGSSFNDSLNNLAAAITLSAGSGVAYAAATTINATVTADIVTTTSRNNVINLTAKTAGTGGNALATTETCAHAAFDAVTLLGGVAEAAVVFKNVGVGFVPLRCRKILSGGTAAQFIIGLL